MLKLTAPLLIPLNTSVIGIMPLPGGCRPNFCGVCGVSINESAAKGPNLGLIV